MHIWAILTHQLLLCILCKVTGYKAYPSCYWARGGLDRDDWPPVQLQMSWNVFGLLDERANSTLKGQGLGLKPRTRGDNPELCPPPGISMMLKHCCPSVKTFRTEQQFKRGGVRGVRGLTGRWRGRTIHSSSCSHLCCLSPSTLHTGDWQQVVVSLL